MSLITLAVAGAKRRTTFTTVFIIVIIDLNVINVIIVIKMQYHDISLVGKLVGNDSKVPGLGALLPRVKVV